jgi:hypothetical protein
MDFPNFPPKPPPTLEGLPTELCIQICFAKDNSGDFILDATSALNLSIASKTMYSKAHDGFLQRAVALPKCSLTPWSLDTLEELSEHERMRKKVKAMEFGPELLNTRLKQVLGLDSYGLMNDPPGNAHPGAYLITSWLIWPVVRLRWGEVQQKLLSVHWNSRFMGNVWQ